MTETSPSQRPRPAVLGAAAAVLAGAALYMLWPAASPRPAPSNPPRDERPVATANPAAPRDLDVRLDALKQPPPERGDEARNPFRFYVKPPPPPPPPKPAPPVEQGPVGPPPPPQPPPIPPIPLKFIGTMEQGKKKVAIFSDGKGTPLYAAEGQLVLGEYRLVRIQIESVVMEYADGRGRQTIPMRG